MDDYHYQRNSGFYISTSKEYMKKTKKTKKEKTLNLKFPEEKKKFMK